MQQGNFIELFINKITLFASSIKLPCCNKLAFHIISKGLSIAGTTGFIIGDLKVSYL